MHVYKCACVTIYEIYWSFCKYKGNLVYHERLLLHKIKVVVCVNPPDRETGVMYGQYMINFIFLFLCIGHQQLAHCLVVKC